MGKRVPDDTATERSTLPSMAVAETRTKARTTGVLVDLGCALRGRAGLIGGLVFIGCITWGAIILWLDRAEDNLAAQARLAAVQLAQAGSDVAASTIGLADLVRRAVEADLDRRRGAGGNVDLDGLRGFIESIDPPALIVDIAVAGSDHALTTVHPATNRASRDGQSIVGGDDRTIEELRIVPAARTDQTGRPTMLTLAWPIARPTDDARMIVMRVDASDVERTLIRGIDGTIRSAALVGQDGTPLLETSVESTPGHASAGDPNPDPVVVTQPLQGWPLSTAVAVDPAPTLSPLDSGVARVIVSGLLWSFALLMVGWSGIRAEMSTIRQRQALEDALRDAEIASQAKSHFLSSMSHEFRTPLNAILGFSEMMRANVFGPVSPPRYTDYVDTIHNAGTHLLSLINSVLDLSAIEAGKMRLRPERIDIVHEIEATLKTLSIAAEGKSIEINLSFSSRPVIQADRRAVTQIFLNLVGNAIKFTPKSGVIDITVASFPDRARIFVVDSGVGIPREALDRLGEPFIRIDNAFIASAQGAGLGIAIAQGLVQALGGQIRFESALNRGTRVIVDLPVAPASRKAA